MKKVLIGVVVLAIVGGIAYILLSRGGLGATAATATPVPEAAQEPVKARNEVVADAIVVPERTANLSLPTGGIVAEVFVEEGDVVDAGQALVHQSPGADLQPAHAPDNLPRGQGTSTASKTRWIISSGVIDSASASKERIRRCRKTSGPMALTSSGVTNPRPLRNA